MAHELSIRADGTAEMAYIAGTKPWHGLGQELREGAPIEEWIVAAGFDWRINRSAVRYLPFADATPDAVMTMNDRHVLLRSDTKAALAVVSDSYKVVQPQAIMEFFRDLTDSAGMILTTAGMLFGGRRFWALASTGESRAIADPKDRVQRYVLLSTACDGSMVTEARYTDICVVCNNTLGAARSRGAARVKVSHRTTFDPAEVKKELGLENLKEDFAETMDQMRRLADAPLEDTAAWLQTAELLHPGSKDLETMSDDLRKVLDSKPVSRIAELALDGVQIGADLGGRQGTQWAWVNAVTQYVDHEARARSADNRVNSAWFGPGAALKERAFEMAVEAVKVSA